MSKTYTGKLMSDTYTGDLNVGDVKAVFDYLSTYSGPFKPGTPQVLAEDRAKNTGTVKGLVKLKFDELNADGTVKTPLCDVLDMDADVGECMSLSYEPAEPIPCYGNYNKLCDVLGSCIIHLPTTTGTYYYGIKTWGETESEPSYPVPDSPGQPANAKAWSVVVEVPCTCTAWANAECTAVGKRRQTRVCTPAGCDTESRIIDDATCKPNGDITKVTLDDKLLPEGGTLDWILDDDAHVKVFFKNIGNVASTFHIWLTNDTGVPVGTGPTIIGCDITTSSIAADNTEYYVDLCVFLPDIVEVKTLTAHIDP